MSNCEHLVAHLVSLCPYSIAVTLGLNVIGVHADRNACGNRVMASNGLKGTLSESLSSLTQMSIL